MDNQMIRNLGIYNWKKFSLRYASILIIGFFIAVIVTLLPRNFLLAHSILELICIYIEISIFLITWSTYKNIPNILYMVGFGFLAVSVMDFFHGYYSIATPLFQQGYEDLAARYWILARLLAAVSLFSMSLNLKIKRVNKITMLIFTVLFSIGLSYLLMKYPGIFPLMRLGSGLTWVKIGMEYVIIAITFLSIHYINVKHCEESVFLNQNILMVLLLIIPTEFIFTLTDDPSSLFYHYGHILKVISFFYLYRGIVTNIITFPYSELEAKCRKLEEKVNEINCLRDAKCIAEMDSQNKSEYIANMSHELRTPLNVLLSGIQLFELYMNGDSSPKTRKMMKHLQSMKQNCLRQLRLVNNLIDTTKIDAGFLNLEFRMYNIIRIIENITTSLQDYVASKNIEIQFHSELKEMNMLCDVDAIERIMMNLISNSIKFTKAKGIIAIIVRKHQGQIEISVKDNGIGIPEDKLDDIFDRYKQVKDTTKKDKEGSGIGLSLTKALVELHGGNIRVSSKLGSGSEFNIELPINILSDASDMDTTKNGVENDSSDLIQIMNIEFSDIYE
ncbi:MASE3 domain-containing protein [Sinanaerobacter chloroacetimidivorans]|uniref:histidine kinase n=1 Tax=Sinanaerobacter chloroacetimidivorans TaxID=2818044 RepID=A0A8J8B3C3_9FIRM|nr:MASE3 domain-containing protein [Sinanaerobacter chloroacetimidivorans]MBR0598165.1 ATP-binding protein [Sinanaerobacter chloroacetimidivorans]